MRIFVISVQSGTKCAIFIKKAVIIAQILSFTLIKLVQINLADTPYKLFTV